MLEVCVDSLESAVNAVENNADELEVCSSLPEGGLTPTPGLVKEVLRVVNNHLKNNEKGRKQKPKVNIMIRCRAGSDFCYSNLELTTMLADIEFFKKIGVDRFVFGSLTDSRRVDDLQCSKVLAAAYPLPVTFHRAYDMCKDPIQALEDVIQLGFTRVLTSGQRASAAEGDAVKLIKTLIEKYGDKIEIMPGAGINADNAKMFINMGCKIVHSSCKIKRSLPKIGNNVAMGTNGCEQFYVTDGSLVQRIKNIITLEL